jgi:chemotaxis protein histidine kinase CheA
MISSYLRKFVENNLRIIIPTVGAFLRKNDASIPFEAALIFSPFLRSSDGLLEELVAAEMNITKAAASEKVGELIEDIQKTIAANRPFYVDRLGVFYQDERGAVQFIYAETERDGNRKFSEVVAKSEGRNVTFLENTHSVEKAPATQAAVEQVPVKKTTDDSNSRQDDAPDETLTAASAGSSSLQDNVAAKKVRQLEVANNSLQRWIEKRKNDIAKSAEKVPPAQNTAKEKNDPTHAAPDVQAEAAQDLAKKTYHEQQKQQEKKERERYAFESAAEQEAKRRRQEAIAHALAEKIRKKQGALEAEEEQRKQREAAPLSGGNSAPLVPGAWEEDVMGKRKASFYGMWIFLLTMLTAFVIGMIALLYSDDMSAFFNSSDEVDTEILAPALPPARAEPAQIAAPARQPKTYYIVAGVFSFEHNARAVAEKLYEAKRLTSKVVQMPDGKFAISLAKYSSRDDALKDFARYKRKYSNVWIAS